MLPIAMILGAILYNPITVLNEKLPHLTQALIFAMLLVPYCRISLRELRIERLHIWLITIQIIGSLAVYGVLLLFDPLIAEGTLICILAPTATAAAVITFMLHDGRTSFPHYFFFYRYSYRHTVYRIIFHNLPANDSVAHFPLYHGHCIALSTAESTLYAE